jgi:heme exporter protein D
MGVLVWLGLVLLVLAVVALVLLALRRQRRAGGVIATKAKR